MTILSRAFRLDEKRIWVAGHGGMVGSALVRRLSQTRARVITVSHSELDLRNQKAVESWMTGQRPDAVLVAAATVGGIEANRTRPAEFLYDNLMIAANIIHAAAGSGVEKLMFLGSACCYPRDADQPMTEESLLKGPLEPTNEAYAVAKIAGVKLCQAYRRQYGSDFIAAVPTNLYGPGDNFDSTSGHVIGSLIRKMHKAKVSNGGPVSLWGSGRALREFMYVDDAAAALIFLMEGYSADDIINVAGGESVSIAELAHVVAEVVGYTGTISFCPEKPDGMPRKVLDGSRLGDMGWRAQTSLTEGLRKTYRWYRANCD